MHETERFLLEAIKYFLFQPSHNFLRCVCSAKNLLHEIFRASHQPSPAFLRRAPQYPSQINDGEQRVTPSVASVAQPDQSPRQRAFLDDIIARRGRLVQVSYDRVAQNPKELTVSRGEFLEVLHF